MKGQSPSPSLGRPKTPLERLTPVIWWVGIVAIVVIAWWFWPRSSSQWLDSVPGRFHGTWHLVPDSLSDNYGVRSFHLSSNSITIYWVVAEDEEDTETFRVRKVYDEWSDKHGHKGKMVIFFGSEDPDHIAEERYQVFYGEKQIITVHEIMATGHNDEQSYFEIGEFVSLDMLMEHAEREVPHFFLGLSEKER